MHQTDFRVTASNGEKNDIGRVMDTVNVSSAQDGQAGEVQVIMPL